MKYKKYIVRIFSILCMLSIVFSVCLNVKADDELNIGNGSPEKEFYARVEAVYNGLDDKYSKRPEYLGAVYFVSNKYGKMRYTDFTTEAIEEIFSYMKTGNTSYTVTEGDNGELSLESASATGDVSEETVTVDESQTTGDSAAVDSSVKAEFHKYTDLSQSQLIGLAYLCYREQGTPKGAAAEASLIANRYELYGHKKYSSIYTYARNSGWWAHSKSFTSHKSVKEKFLSAVKAVLVDGRRTLPKYVDEHDYMGDIKSVSNNGKSISKRSRGSYIPNVTVIKNVMGATYTFYSFPDKNSDPFGYTKPAFQAAAKYGDGHYTFDGSYTEGNGLVVGNDNESTITSTIDLEHFKDELVEKWFSREEFSAYSDVRKQNMAIEVISHVEEYKILMGIKDAPVVGDGKCSYNVEGTTYTEPSVQLLKCEGKNPIDNTELVDFEKYTTGVVSQENGNGPYEALKAQAVAARSYALMREKAMGKGNAYGVGFGTVDGQTVLKLRSCTSDQVYCDPDAGCWSNAPGGQTGRDYPDDQCTVYQTEDTSKNWHKGPIAEDSKIRKAVEETKGQVAVDSTDNIVYTTYVNSDQESWNKMANEGKDYYEILKKHYAKKNVSNITSNCSTSVGNSEAESWRQADPKWGSKLIGSRTLGAVGCMITSTAIQIARSGTKLTVSNFDPGVFLDVIKAHGGTSGNNFQYTGSPWTSIAPNFKYKGSVSFKGSPSEMANQMIPYTTGNKYLIIKVKTHQHWVAVVRIENGKIIMADPASDSTDAASKYNLPNPMEGRYFEKSD